MLNPPLRATPGGLKVAHDGDKNIGNPETGPVGPNVAASTVSVPRPGPVGPIGPVGPVAPVAPCGPDGPDGPCGPLGPDAPDGPSGPLGPLGPDGPAGPALPAGPLGPFGPLGPLGPAGPLVPEGPGGPDGPLGPLGPCRPVAPVAPGAPPCTGQVTCTSFAAQARAVPVPAAVVLGSVMRIAPVEVFTHAYTSAFGSAGFGGTYAKAMVATTTPPAPSNATDGRSARCVSKPMRNCFIPRYPSLP